MKKDDTYSWSMSCLVFIFSVIFLLLYTLHNHLTNIASAEIQLYSQSNSISTCLTHLYYFLTPVNPSFWVATRSVLFITYIYFLARSIRLNIWAIFAYAIVSIILFNSLSFSLAFSKIITSFIVIILIWHTLCCQICDFYSFLFILL